MLKEKEAFETTSSLQKAFSLDVDTYYTLTLTE